VKAELSDQALIIIGPNGGAVGSVPVLGTRAMAGLVT
jgi:hypothetical protein